jgi:hypothetical protein
MSGNRILSDEQIGRMAAMRERGLSYVSIADWFTRNGTPISDRTIRWQCMRVGAFKPGAPHKCLGRQTFGRGRAYTPAEDAEIVAMRNGGRRIGEIARELERPHNSITGRLLTLAMHDAMREAA